MAIVYIALGANLGDRRANLTEALRRMAPEVQVEAVSALYESEPFPPSPPPAYYNAACRATTDLAPLELLRYLKDIETSMGRMPSERWAPRVIDLDIALYGDLVLDTPDLVLPHPRLAERNFVLRPLLDLDETLAHPATGVGLAHLLEEVAEQGLVRVAGTGWSNNFTR